MTVPSMCSSSSAPPSREVALRLFQRNIELEDARRKAAKLKIPSDQNTWTQMRDNFETIILEDHDFSEQQGIEQSLWQLHHRKIDEHRALLRAASVGAQAEKLSSRPDRIKRVSSAFKSFLSEATGFYHDLILKIRAKHGLSLGYFSEGLENQIMAKDDRKSSKMRKGLKSCHRCLIFLGDLARYKGMYGDSESAMRDYAAASSYYQQAASFWPSSGNPHHQLAVLAICTDDNELTVLYRYFRCLAVKNPLLTARDNLIIAFEKNRQRYLHLPSSPKATLVKAVPTQTTGRGRCYFRDQAKDIKNELTPVKGRELSMPEIFNSFCIRFVRLNGILYTRTSLETFGEVFSSVASDLSELLSSGPDEGLNFGSDAAENGMIIIKLISILIFTVHNVKKESDGQSYVEILQRSVLLQNAFAAAFDFMGHIVKRCIELRDATTSYLLPAILVFIEWLACHSDIAAGIDTDERQSSSRTFFWKQFVYLMNKLLLSGYVSFGGDEDEACFIDMGKYDEGQNDSCLALWEDFELRGFVPLAQAQLILNFSSKHSFRSDWDNREKRSRIQRILGAGRALMNVVHVDQQRIYFHSRLKEFIIGEDSQTFDDKFQGACSDFSKPNGVSPAESCPIEKTGNFGASQSKTQLHGDGEDDEVIVFKPTIVERSPNRLTSAAHEIIQPVQEKCHNGLEAVGFDIISSSLNSSVDWMTSVRPLSTSLANKPQYAFNASSYMLSAPGDTFQQPLQSASDASRDMNSASVDTLQWSLEHANLIDSKWLTDQETFFSDPKNLRITENGFGARQGMWEGVAALQPTLSPLPFSVSDNSSVSSLFSNKIKAVEINIPSKLDSVMPVGTSSIGLVMDPSPLGHPGRQFGPPPGFSSAPSKQVDALVSSSLEDEIPPLVDDYSWLDGYSSTKDLTTEHSLSHTADIYPHVISGPRDSLVGNRIHTTRAQVDINKIWQDFPLIPHQKCYTEKQIQHGNQQPTPMLEHYQSLWQNHFV